MSCRTTPAGSAFTSLARLSLPEGSDVSDPACLSAFHRLRATYNQNYSQNGSWAAYTHPGRYQQIIDTALESLPRRGFTPAREASIRRRLEEARLNPPTTRDGEIDGSVVFAISRIEDAVSDEAAYRREMLREVASLNGQSVEEARTQFADYQRQAPRRREHALDGFGARAVAHARNSSVNSHDAATLYATARMYEEGEQIQMERARALPRAIEQQQPLTGTSRHTTIQGVELVSAGYNPLRRRLEVTTSDGETRAYRHVEPNTWQAAVNNGTEGEYWSRNLRGSDYHNYDDEYQQVVDSSAMRCEQCGQFATNMHNCPRAAQPATTYHVRYERHSRQQVELRGGPHDSIHTMRVRLPLVRTFNDMYRQADGPIDLQMSDSFYAPGPISSEWGTIYGVTRVERGEDGAPRVDLTRMRCTCNTFRARGTCSHLDAVQAAIITRLTPPARRRAANAAEARARRNARAAAAAELDWTRTETGREEARRTWREDAEVTYSEDTAAFLADYREVTEALGKDGATVPYMTENAMDGMARPESGQAFGMEIEFDLPDTMTYSEKQRAREAIARDLYDAGITSTDHQRYYQASHRDGYRDYHVDERGRGTWSFESDCSVSGGELVTSGMYDTPETWERLKTATDIIKRHGGVASKHAGMHVHVGTSSYEGNVEAYQELYRTVTQHQDVLYRVAANPERGTHRRGAYAKPNPPMPGTGFRTIGDVRRMQNGRYRALNMGAVSGSRADHPEFRVFDSSLDPGTMQLQAKVAVGIVNAAQRNVMQGGTSRNDEPVGSHQARTGRRRRLSDDELLEDTATARSMADMLFRRRADKKHFLAVFARNKWQAAFR